MTTLPPEDQNTPGSGAGAPGEPQQPPMPPQPPVTPPQPPTAPPQPPAAPQQQYQQPQQGYQQPHQGGYQQPHQGGYQQPHQGYQQHAGDPVTNITLNYWLSVFFTWLPALIFFLVEKDKGNQQAYAYHRDNLNFSLVRTIAYAAIIIMAWIPYIGWLLALLLWIAQIVLFVFHIMAAAKAPAAFRAGQPAPFVFNLQMVK